MVANKFADCALLFPCHDFDKGITLGMYSRVVKGITRVGDAKKARTLLISHTAQAWNFLQFAARSEGTMLMSVVNDVLCEGRAKSTYIGEQMLRGCIEVHSNLVDTAFHSAVKRLFQLCLVHIMLILSHTDALGINLNQFGKWVHKASADRNCSAYREVKVGKLIAPIL